MLDDKTSFLEEEGRQGEEGPAPENAANRIKECQFWGENLIAGSNSLCPSLLPLPQEIDVFLEIMLKITLESIHFNHYLPN